MTGFDWLLQWPIRALVLLLIASLPLGVEFEGFGAALLSAGAIGLLGSLLTLPLKALFLLPWALTSLGGLIQPISLLFNWLITAILFGLAAGFVDGFRLKNGVFSAILGSLAYSIISMVVLSLVFGAI
ncbi:phage holin family protein [Synechococcus lacustris]|uniref:phage holin family protein n=1 Tax=Synechococcus lacustris TaxID=2116544 RepID=UPI0020CFDC12|nr:phage holin family protein [Synechococcus lacustris]MCP9813492.1 phage holin family protein [Synechococcus lacustris L1E-Slac]